MSAIHDSFLAGGGSSQLQQPPPPPPLPRKYRQASPQIAAVGGSGPSFSATATAAGPSSSAPPPLPSRPESERTDSSRPLPPRPGPPRAPVPAWDPETKSHIPPQATVDAREQSYATHAQPPPRLRDVVQAREATTRDQRPGRLVGNAVNGVVVDESSMKAPGRATRGLEGPTTISGEWWLDPALPRALTPMTPRDDGGGGWLKRLGKRKESSAAAAATVTATYRAEKGNIDARLNVVKAAMNDEQLGDGTTAAAAEQTHAVIVVENKRGHVRVEMATLDDERGVDLRIKTRSGNVFLLLPPNFQGRIHCSTSASKPVNLLPALSSKIELISWAGGQFSAVLGTAAGPTSSVASMPPPRRTSSRLRSHQTTIPTLSTNTSATSSSFVPLSTTLAEHDVATTTTNLSPALPGSITLSSLSGHVTLGLFGQEPQKLVGGTMSQLLMQGINQVGGELKRMWKER